jgi:hypothetical protein
MSDPMKTWSLVLVNAMKRLLLPPDVMTGVRCYIGYRWVAAARRDDVCGRRVR